jgi:hypothetical protein
MENPKIYITKAYIEYEDPTIPDSREIKPIDDCEYDPEKKMWYTQKPITEIIKEVGDCIVSPPSGKLEFCWSCKDVKGEWMVISYNGYVE